ncbi:MAG: DUF1566 domain-containing protein [Leptospira sp.]|nr:DUF1566 domain-containing protein [Leptospira sp.]
MKKVYLVLLLVFTNCYFNPLVNSLLNPSEKEDDSLSFLALLGLNNNASQSSVSDISISLSPAPARYTSPVYISLTSSDPEAKIYYTLDGSNPTELSNEYTEPIHIWSIAGADIRYIAIKSDGTSSNVFIAPGYYMYPPLKTGQTECWDSAGELISCINTNHDGEFQFGVERGYLNHGNGTVTDTSTGLIWQKCSKGQNTNDCSGSASTDNWENAKFYCENLNLDGRSWKLPSRKELETLLNKSNSTGNPSIDLGIFPNTVITGYWSSTDFYRDTAYTWRIGFGGSLIINFLKSNNHPTRCVSGYDETLARYSFVNLVEDEVLDNSTGFIWGKCTNGLMGSNCEIGAPTLYNWADAQSSCNSPWRLPNINELKTILNFSKIVGANPDNEAFPNNVNGSYWSSTSYSLNKSRAFYADYNDAKVEQLSKSGLAYARCVKE